MRERTRLEHELAEVAASTATALLNIVDERNQPLDGEQYTVRQGSAVDQGVLAKGKVTLQGVDVDQPFSVEVSGRVLSIVSNGLLKVDDPEAEYGGTLVDWRLADDPKKADTVFWPQYRQLQGYAGPSTFWQHEHLTRRRIRRYAGKAILLQARPLRIRSGPLVRYTSNLRSVIWLETETPAVVRALYRKAADQSGTPRPGTKLDDKGAERRHAATVRVGGRHFAMVILDKLEEDTLYHYTLELAPLPVGSIPVEETQFKDEWFASQSASVKAAVVQQLSASSLRGDRWLYVKTLRRRYDKLRFAHGSCRRWPGDTGENGYSPGEDMLEAMGELWLPSLKSLGEWPSFVLHTGDQIYADDIGVKTGETIVRQRFGAVVPGPFGDDLKAGAWAGRFAHRYLHVEPGRFKASGTLTAIETEERKLAAEVQADVKKAKQSNNWGPVTKKVEDLIKLQKKLKAARKQRSPGDFVTDAKQMRFTHVATNHFLWRVPNYPSDLPAVKNYKIEGRGGSLYPSAGDTNNVHASDFAEYSYLYEKAWTTPHAKKVFANLPHYMMFDDHEITDDWNMDLNWSKLIFPKPEAEYPYWPEAITDGLIAYWMYQGWGNISPSVWRERKLAKILVDARQSGKDALPALRELVRKQATQPPGDLIFHYKLPIDSPLVLVADMRTRKQLRADDSSSVAFDKPQLDWLLGNLKAQDAGAAAFLVMSLPYLVPSFVSMLERHAGFFAKLTSTGREEFVRGKYFDMEHPVMTGTWMALQERLLAEMQDSVTPLKSLVLISGDVHMSFNLRANLRKDGYEVPPEILQLVSSGSRNAVDDHTRDIIRTALSWFDTNHKIGDLRIQPGGFEGVRGEKRSILFDTSIALVDAKVTGGKVELHQQYLVRDKGARSLRTLDVWYKKSEIEQYLTPVSRG